jgi:hypothetical protein
MTHFAHTTTTVVYAASTKRKNKDEIGAELQSPWAYSISTQWGKTKQQDVGRVTLTMSRPNSINAFASPESSISLLRRSADIFRYENSNLFFFSEGR